MEQAPDESFVFLLCLYLLFIITSSVVFGSESLLQCSGSESHEKWLSAPQRLHFSKIVFSSDSEDLVMKLFWLRLHCKGFNLVGSFNIQVVNLIYFYPAG